MSFVDTKRFVRQWLERTPIDEMSGLDVGKSYIDLKGGSGRLLGCIAIKFNRNVLYLDPPRRWISLRTYSTPALVEAVQECRFLPLPVHENVMFKLRAMLHEAVTPALRECDAFDRWLPHMPPPMKPLGIAKLGNGFDNMILKRARIANAFDHDGKMTHVLVRVIEDDNETDFKITNYHSSADDALLEYMTVANPKDYRVVEI